MKHRIFAILTLLALLLVSVVPLTAQDATECEDGFRPYEHALGETCIPTNPERIVAVGADATEALIALDILPVGFATWSGFADVADVPDYIAFLADLNESVFLGSEAAPNLEAVVALEPDLIIVREYQEDVYGLLSEVAPTVALTAYIRDEGRVVWKDFLTEVGAVTGTEAEAERLLTAYSERADFLASIVAQQPTTVSLLRFDPSRVRIYLTTSYPGGIMQDAGILRPEAQDKPGFVEEISLETLQLADGDIMLLAQSDPERALSDQFTQSPLWQTLNAVQNENVIEIDYGIWIAGASVISAHYVLDDLFRYVAGVDPQEVSPNPFAPGEDIPEATEEASN